VVVAAHGSDGIGGTCTGVMRVGIMRVGVMRMARWLVMLAVATLIAPGDAVAPAALVRGVLPAIASVGRKHPCLFGCAVTTLKTASADIFTQKVIQKKPTVDLKRVGLFATFGLLYMGAFQYGLYNFAYTRMFPAAANFASYPLRQKLTDGRGAAAVCGKVAFDQFVHWPFLAFPCFYTTKHAIEHGEVHPRSAIKAYRGNMWLDNQTLWKVWIPAELIMFGCLPLHWQVPFAASISFVYTVLLSASRG